MRVLIPNNEAQKLVAALVQAGTREICRMFRRAARAVELSNR